MLGLTHLPRRNDVIQLQDDLNKFASMPLRAYIASLFSKVIDYKPDQSLEVLDGEPRARGMIAMPEKLPRPNRG